LAHEAERELADEEQKLQAARKRIPQLRAAIAIFRKNAETGAWFPESGRKE
jgi:hypothetical protein